MIQSNEDRIVKSLETIAKCMLKQNKMAEEAIKKTQELYEANMTMMKENSQIDYDGEMTKKEQFPQGIEPLKNIDGT